MRYLHPTLVTVTVAAHLLNASAAVLYVDMNSTNPVPPYADWSTAATNIQDAVDAANSGDLVLVSNGVYQTGQTPTPVLPPPVGALETSNRVTVTKPIVVQSVKGPAVTIIQGYQLPDTINGHGAVRCVFLTNGATITGFTLRGGATEPGEEGGGILCRSNSWVSDCLIVSNSADAGGGGAVAGGTLTHCALAENSALGTSFSGFTFAAGGGALNCTLINCLILSNSVVGPLGSVFPGNEIGPVGGGAADATLINCVVSGNHADFDGGGTYVCTLVNCTLVGNSSTNGGGNFAGSITNSILWDNVAPVNPDYNPQTCTLVNCCVPSLPTDSNPYLINNITSAPQFVNESVGDYHLQSNSPCINSGRNAYVPIETDLDGQPRISGGTVDIGAYEYQNPASVISYAWLQQYGLPTDGSADFADTDGDGMNDWQEWRAGTNPTNSLSVLKMLSVSNSPAGAMVTWQSAAGLTYFLQSTTNPGVQPFTSIQSNLLGQVGSTNFIDATATNAGSVFYRVGVQ